MRGGRTTTKDLLIVAGCRRAQWSSRKEKQSKRMREDLREEREIRGMGVEIKKPTMANAVRRGKQRQRSYERDEWRVAIERAVKSKGPRNRDNNGR